MKATKKTTQKRKTTKNKAKARLDAMATALAKDLGIETLEVRNWDQYDFQEVFVGSLKDALQRAFVLGMQAGESEPHNVPVFIDAL